MSRNEKQTEMSKDIIDKLFARLTVAEITIVILSERLGQSSTVTEDLDVLLKQLSKHEALQKEKLNPLRDEMIHSAKQMKQLLSLNKNESSQESA